MSAEKILVTKSDTAVIECPKCKNRKSVLVGPYRGKKHAMKVKCTCSHVFGVELNFRKHYRKKDSLEATYQTAGLNMPGTYQNSSKKDAARVNLTNCIVKDLSFEGVGFEVVGRHLIEPGSKLTIKFNLDNPQKTFVQKEIIVKTVRGNFIGAKFTETVAHDPTLGFYLMP